jgi:hypothetical protein
MFGGPPQLIGPSFVREWNANEARLRFDLLMVRSLRRVAISMSALDLLALILALRSFEDRTRGAIAVVSNTQLVFLHLTLHGARKLLLLIHLFDASHETRRHLPHDRFDLSGLGQVLVGLEL